MTDIDALQGLRAIVGDPFVVAGDQINPDDLHDESLHPREVHPLAVVRPATTAEVSAIARWATTHAVPLTPRGSGTGLSGGAVPVNGGVVVAFDRMNRVLHVDVDDHVAVVQPGVTLRELAESLAGTGLWYPVYPGELSGSLGGNVNTNAGGMRAVRHGVTRHHVLGLELVRMDGSVLRTGGAVVKSSSGYDLTQLVIGSEGTLAMVTEVTVRLSPAFPHAATVLVPFADLADVTRVVPRIITAGLQPSILEYLDALVMASVARGADVELAISEEIRQRAVAYLLIVLETRTSDQLDSDLEGLAGLLETADALDVFVLHHSVATRLIESRERAFWSAKAAGASDIIDIAVPRSKVPEFLLAATTMAHETGSLLTGCGHVGDGNVHFSLFQQDAERREQFLSALFALGVQMGGVVSGEHGIGRDKQRPFLALADPSSLALQRAIKDVFDPAGLLNPHRLLDERPLP